MLLFSHVFIITLTICCAHQHRNHSSGSNRFLDDESAQQKLYIFMKNDKGKILRELLELFENQKKGGKGRERALFLVMNERNMLKIHKNTTILMLETFLSSFRNRKSFQKGGELSPTI